MQYDYLVPDEWEAVVGSNSIVLAHSSGEARITLQERTVDRSRLRSVNEIADSIVPAGFVDWTERSLSSVHIPGDGTAMFSYSGTKFGKSHVATAQWYLWGELLVEVAVEAEATLWAADSRLRNTALLVASSFAPRSETPSIASGQVADQLRIRFSVRPARIFASAGNGLAATELTCKQVFHDLLSEPVYVGAGVWQAFAVAEQGVQVWQIFEPTLTIIPASHNTSTC